MLLSAGDRLGPYQIVAAAGEGGMGEVYKAHDTRLDRMIAIKVLKEKYGERFEKEARTLAALQHPHICSLYDVGEHSSGSYLVMEYIEGKPLREPLPLQRAIEYGVQISRALDHAHRKGIVHRDLKPGNILLTKSGVKLLDFGLAKLVDGAPVGPDEATRTWTTDGAVVGTPQYMAPEQIEGSKVDARTDIFALGLVLYEWIAGKPAFQGDSAAGVMASILKTDPPPLPDSPYAKVVHTCLAKDPEERWQSAREVEHALHWLESATAKPSPASSSGRYLWWGATGLLALVAGAGWFSALRSGSPAIGAAYRFSLEPPEGAELAEFAFSPDGRNLALTGRTARGMSLWIRPLDSQQSTEIPTGFAGEPFWSPDGRHVGFFAQEKLRRADIASGQVQDICQANTPRGATWNRDGVIVFAPQPDGALFRVSAGGGSPQQITQLNRALGQTAHYWPWFLPDGVHFLYWARNADRSKSTLHVTSLVDPGHSTALIQTDTRVVFVPGVQGAGFLVWAQDGKLTALKFDPHGLRVEGKSLTLGGEIQSYPGNGSAAFSVSGRGLLAFRGRAEIDIAIQWTGRDGRRLRSLALPVGSFAGGRLSPDGRSVALRRFDASGNHDIWVFSLDSERLVRITFDPNTDASPVWSPEGKYVAYSASRGGQAFNLFRRDADGAKPEERLTQSTNMQNLLDWSWDGKWLLYSEVDPKTGPDLWMVSASGKGPSVPLLQMPHAEIEGRFCPIPDSGVIAYTSNDSGRSEVYAGAFDPAAPEKGLRGRWQVSTNGGSSPTWRRDGHELFYLAPNSSLMSVSVGQLTPLQAGSPKAIMPKVVSAAYEVAADGQSFLFREVVRTTEKPISVIVNWESLAGSSR